jgi:hypothetical protein
MTRVLSGRRVPMTRKVLRWIVVRSIVGYDFRNFQKSPLES